jgi:adenosylhomocysteine nucleosidase
VRTVLVVAANPFELKFVPQTTGRVRFVLACGGEGPSLVRRAMDQVVAKTRGSFDAVVSTGVCGALDPALGVGDVFVAESVNGGAPCRLPATSLAYCKGALISVDRIVVTVAERRKLFASGYAAVEMEAAAVEARARELGTEFYCIRAVSDTASEEFAVDLNAARDTEGKIRVGRILWQAAFRPVTAFPQLLHLKRNADTASRALGAFLATCEF